MNELDHEGNSLYLRATTAMEKGESAKAEHLLREIVDLLGREHFMSHRSMKTLSEIAVEQGRMDDAIKMSLELLYAQIHCFGPNHSESTQTANTLRYMCRQTKNDAMFQKVERVVKEASDFDKELRSMKGLKSSAEEKKEEEDSLRHKVMKKIAAQFAKLFKGGVTEHEMPGGLIVGWVVGTFIACYMILFFTNMSYGNDGNIELMKHGTEYVTTDGGKKLELLSSDTLAAYHGTKRLEFQFKSFGQNWRDIAPLMCSPLWQKELWLIEHPEGITGLDNEVYYHTYAPEMAIIHQMKDVMTTANHYYKERNNYPKNIQQMSRSNFRYMNPFTKEMDFPNVRTVTCEDARQAAVFFNELKNNGTWPREAQLYPGAINCCRVSIASTSEQHFVIHGCDRYGKLLTASDGKTMLMMASAGVLDKPQTPAFDPGIRLPTFWILRVPPEVVAFALPLLQIRFIALYAVLSVVFLILFLANRDNTAKAQTMALLALSTSAGVFALLSMKLP